MRASAPCSRTRTGSEKYVMVAPVTDVLCVVCIGARITVLAAAMTGRDRSQPLS